ncbi:MAG: hypothetical protein HYS83_00035 [Candidatus Blackburnbacteria bacterium]|nr:hypothetical protein [Candidatus Blackburnbacteria bacterium]
MKKLPNDNNKQQTTNNKRPDITIPGVLLLLFALFTIHYSLFAPPSFAQVKFDTSLEQFQKALNSGQYNKETFDLQSVIGMSGSLYTLLAGCRSDDVNCPQALRTGAVDKLGETIAGIYAVPPASGIYYASTIFERLNPVQPAYAQEAGTGFRVLGPFLTFWKAVRNMVYVLFALGAVILGIMIMFRTKISPQVVMTIQAALPRLVAGLIMVTFSYAIVGFLIDLTYVGIGAFMWALKGAGLKAYDAEIYFNTYTNAGFQETVGTVFGRGLSSGWDIFTGTISADWASIGVSAVLAGILGAAVLSIPGVAGAAGAGLILVLLGLVVTIIFFLIRILFALARAYLMLLIYLILGPLFILWATLSGSGVWSGWLRGVLANLLVFPAVGFVIFFAGVLIQQLMNVGSDIWGPPYLGRHGVLIQGIIGFGSIILIPQIPDIINQLLGIRAPRIEFPAIGRQFEPITRAVQTGIERRVRGERPQGEGVFKIPFRRPRARTMSAQATEEEAE